MAKYRCPNLGDSEVKQQFNELVKSFGEPKAYFLWNSIMNGDIKFEEKKEVKEEPKETKKRPPKPRTDFDEADALPEVSGLPSVDFNRLKITSFTSLKNLQQENEIVNSLVNAFLKKVDNIKRQDKIPVVDSVFNSILNDLKRLSEWYNYFTEEVTKEDIEDGALETPELNKARVANLNHIIDNFGLSKDTQGNIEFIGYKERMLGRIARLNYNVLDDLESDEQALERTNYEDGFMFKVDAEASMSAQVKRMLSFIPKKDKDGNKKSNIIGYTIYEDYNKVYSLIMNELVDIPIEELHDELVELANRNQIASDVLDYLDNLQTTDEQSYNKFMTVFRRQRANFITLLATPQIKNKDGSTNPRSINIIETNRSGAADIVINGWSENFKSIGIDSGLINMNLETGNLTININKAKELKKEFDDIVKLDYKDQVKKLPELLNKIGIDITEDDLKRLNTFRQKALDKKSLNKYSRYYDKHSTFTNFLTKEMGYIFNTLAGTIKEESIEEPWQLNNPFHSQINRIKGLSVYYLERHPEITSNTFKNGSGDSIQGVVMPHHSSNRIQKIQTNEAYRNLLLKIPFVKEALWLNQQVKMKYFDSAKMKDSRQDSKSYAEQSPTEKEYTKIGLFQKSGQDAVMIGNTPSDKTTFTLFETLRHVVNFGNNDDVFDDGEVNSQFIDLESPTMKLLYDNLVQSEINRIKIVREAYNKYIKTDINKLIPGYHYFTEKSTTGEVRYVPGSGTYFFFIPELNEVSKEYITKDGNFLEGLEGNQLFKEILRDKVVSLINDKVKSWNEKNIVNTKKGTFDFDKTYASKLAGRVSKNNKPGNIINTAAAEMVTNYMLTYANQFMTVTGDPALFTKPGHKFTDYKDLISKTADNIFKRTAKDIAPGIEGKFDSTTFNTIFINEPKHTPELNKYKSRLGSVADVYNNLDIADAQEWTTLKEHLNVLFAYGKISKEVRDTLIKKAELRLTAENKEQYNFTWAELGTVLQPVKPVYVNSKYDEDTQTDVHYYIKTSSFPLIPQLTEGFEIDNLRTAMETNNIDRAVVNSGVKVGFANSISIFTKDGINIPSNLSSYIKSLYRDGFRIQQEVPYDATKNEILEGSQLRKLKFANLTADLEFSFNGDKLKGYELKKIDDKIHNRLYQIRYNKLLESLGIKPGDNTIENVNKLRDVLIETAQELSYTENDILLLNTITTEGGVISFDNPLYFHNESDRIESMLNSIIKNRVLKNKMKGKSYVQGSSVGFTMKSEQFAKNMEEFSGKRIALTKDFSGQPLYKGSLEYREYEEDGKKIIYAEVFAPFNFLTANQESGLKLEDYVDEKGFIINDKIDSKLFNALGYRIPTQGHSSMVKLKIVGFLPQEAGDLVIVPSAITKQMGADFDVDKLYTHFYNYTTHPNGRLDKVEYSDKEFNELEVEQLQNMSMDITYSILSNETVQNKYQFTPTDDPTLGKDKEYINEKLRASDTKNARIKPEQSTILSDEFQSHMVEINAAGKIGIGSYSSASANHILFQYAGVYLTTPTDNKGQVIPNKVITVMFNDESGNTYTDKLSGTDFDTNRVNDKNQISYDNAPTDGAWRLDKVWTFSGKLISDVIKSYQSASVDNAKDQNLYDLHQNKGTFNVSWLIARAGFDEYFIDRFMTQPIIVDYVKRLNELDNYTSSEFVPNKRKKLQEQMFKELGFDLNTWTMGITPVSISQMENGIKSNGSSKLFQAQILYNFLKYSEAATEISRIQTAANTDTAFLGKSIYESIIKLDRVTEKRTYLGNTDNLFDETTQAGAVQYGLQASVDLFANNNLYPLRSKAVRTIFETIQQQLDRDLTEDVAHTIFSDIRASLFTQAIKEVYNEDINTLRRNLLYGTKDKQSLAKDIRDLQNLTTNPFLKTLAVKTANKVDEPDVIEFYASKEIKEELTMDMILGWNELLNAPEGSKEREVGERLVQYALVVGNQRSARDFGRFIPYDYISNKLAKYFRSLDFDNSNDTIDSLQANFVTQWFQHNPYKAREVEAKQILTSVTFDGKPVAKDGLADVITLKELTSKDMEELGSYQGGEAMDYPLVLSYNHVNKNKEKEIILYKREGETNMYVRIPVLGLTNKLIKEYNIGLSTQSSIFREKSKTVTKNVTIKQTPVTPKTTVELFESYDFSSGIEAVLENIYLTGKNQGLKKVAKFYLDNIDLLKGYKLEYYQPSDNAKYNVEFEPAGLAVYNERLVLLNKNKVKDNLAFEVTFLHELTHMMLYVKLGLEHKRNTELKSIMDKLSAHTRLLYDKEWLTSIGVPVVDVFGTDLKGYRFADYIFTDTQEFAAILMTDPYLQKILANIPYDEKQSFWDKILEFIRDVLGVDSKDSMLTAGMDTVLRIINPEQFANETEPKVNLGFKKQGTREYTPENITSLKDNEIFVFGSNEGDSRGGKPTHGRGAAKLARDKFGAIQGQSRGLQGQSYAIVTKKYWDKEKSSTLNEIFQELLDFNQFAYENKDKKFLVTKLGSSLAGYSIDEIKQLFAKIEGYEGVSDNIILPKEYEVRDAEPEIKVNLGFKEPEVNIFNKPPVKPTVVTTDGNYTDGYGTFYKFELNEDGELINGYFSQGNMTDWQLMNKKNALTKYADKDKLDKVINKPEPSSTSKNTFLYKGTEIATEFELGKDQKTALESLIDFVQTGNRDHDIDSVITLEGAAGTGKTAIIGYLQKYFKGKASFAFLAPTHAATAELGFATVKSGNTKLPSTIQSSIVFNKEKNKYVFTKKVATGLGLRPVIVVDESSMIDKDDVNHLIQATYDVGGKLIFMGDEKQIPKVTKDKSDTKPLSPAFTNFRKLKLTEIFRQSENSILSLLSKMREQTSFNLFKVPNSNSVKFLSKRDYNEELLKDLQNDPENTVVISYTNKVVQQANIAIREALGREGETKTGDIIVGYLGYASKQIEKGDLANSLNYTITNISENGSERLIKAKSSKLTKLIDSGITNVTDTASTTYYQMGKGDSLTFNNLTSEDFEKNNKYVAGIFREIHNANTRYANKQMSYSSYLEFLFAMSDTLRKVSVGQDYIYNPASDRMEVYDAKRHTGIKNSGNGSLLMSKDVDYGHAITIHKSQGTTITNVYFDTTGLKAAPNTKVVNTQNEAVTSENQSLAYVAMSRAKKKLVVYEGDMGFSEINTYSGLPSVSESKFPVYPKGRIFKKAIENGKYIAEIGVSEVKRRVTDKYFRFRGTTDFNNKSIPYYDYSTGSIHSDKKLIEKINSEYNGKVVRYNPSRERIVFTDNASNQTLIEKASATPDFTLQDELFETNYDKMIVIKEKQIEILRKKLVERDTDKYDIRNKIAELEVEIKYIKANKKDIALEEVIVKNIKAVTKTLNNIDNNINDNPDLEQLYIIAKNLSEVDIYIEGLRDIDKLFSYEESGDSQKRIDSYMGTINRQREKYLNQFKEVTTRIANKIGSKRFSNITSEELFGATEDINFAVREAMNMANSKSMLTRFLHQLIQLAKQNIIDKQTVIAGEIEAWEKKLEQHTKLKGDALHDIFMQKYEDGSWTGNYVNRYKQEFFDELAEVKKSIKEHKQNKLALTRWMKENSTMITIDEITSGKSSVFTAEEMKRQAELIEKYEANLKSTVEALQNMYVKEDGTIDTAKVDLETELWENKNSPYIYLDVYNGKKKGKYLMNKGNRYLILPKPKDKWIDKNFDRIEKDPLLKEFYTFMTNTFTDNNKYLPYLTKLPGNYLPEVHKTFAEQIKTQSMWESLTGVGDDFWNAITDQMEGEIDYNVRLGNRKFKTIPTKMMLNKLTADKKSRNVFKILKAHSAIANSYYYKSQIEPLLISGQQQLEEMDEITKADTVKGDITKKDAWRKNDTVRGNLVNTKKQLEHQVEVFLYDNYRDVEGRIGKAKLSKEDKVKLEELDTLLKDKKITQAQYDTRVSLLGRQVTTTGIFDVVNKYTYLKALGLPNFITPAVNLTFGMASNFTYAAGGIGVNLTDMRKATNIFTGAVIDRNNLRKIGAFMEQLGILNEYNESLYGTSRTVVDNLAFYLQNNTEKMNRGVMMLAHLLNSKVKNKNGEEVSLFYAYKEVDGKLVWDTENFGEMQVPEKGRVGEHGVNMFKFKTYITRVNQKVHGDYDSSLRAKRTVVGRVVGMFKTWMPMAIVDRFGKLDYDDELEQDVKGRYFVPWTAKDNEGKDVEFKDFMKIISTAAFKKNGLAGLSELDRALVRRNLKELQFIVEFALAVAAMGLIVGAGDDDEEYKFVLRTAINLLNKAQNDLAFFTNPAAMTQVFNNFVPIVSTIRDVTNVVPVVYKTVTGDPTYQSGLLEGQNRLAMWGVQALPFTGPGLRMWKNGERIIENW